MFSSFSPHTADTDPQEVQTIASTAGVYLRFGVMVTVVFDLGFGVAVLLIWGFGVAVVFTWVIYIFGFTVEEGFDFRVAVVFDLAFRVAVVLILE